jgi:hypothetical protein
LRKKGLDSRLSWRKLKNQLKNSVRSRQKLKEKKLPFWSRKDRREKQKKRETDWKSKGKLKKLKRKSNRLRKKKPKRKIQFMKIQRIFLKMLQSIINQVLCHKLRLNLLRKMHSMHLSPSYLILICHWKSKESFT